MENTRTFALLGIDKYHHSRLLCLVQAPTLREAVSKLGGELWPLPDHAKLLNFESDAEAGVFIPGNCTFEVIAQAAAALAPGSRSAVAICEHLNYSARNVYRQFLIGSAPTV